MTEKILKREYGRDITYVVVKTEEGVPLTDMELVDCVEADCSCFDFEWFSEGLYKDAAGQLWFHGRGKAKSVYRVDTGNGWAPGEIVEKISLSRAIRWAKANNLDKTAKKLEALQLQNKEVLQ